MRVVCTYARKSDVTRIFQDSLLLMRAHFVKKKKKKKEKEKKN